MMMMMMTGPGYLLLVLLESTFRPQQQGPEGAKRVTRTWSAARPVPFAACWMCLCTMYLNSPQSLGKLGLELQGLGRVGFAVEAPDYKDFNTDALDVRIAESLFCQILHGRLQKGWSLDIRSERRLTVGIRGITGMAVQDDPRTTLASGLSRSARLHGTRHQELLPRLKGRDATIGRAHGLVETKRLLDLGQVGAWCLLETTFPCFSECLGSAVAVAGSASSEKPTTQTDRPNKRVEHVREETPTKQAHLSHGCSPHECPSRRSRARDPDTCLGWASSASECRALTLSPRRQPIQTAMKSSDS